MSFHITNLGMFGNNIRPDINGYVPTEDTGAFDLVYDHGVEETHNNGELTEYGEWWISEGFQEIQSANIKATAEANDAIWRNANA